MVGGGTSHGLILVQVVVNLHLPLDHDTLAFFLSTTLQQQPVSTYNIQLTFTLASVTSIFSLSVSSTILDL
jgi:hypothetical protein